MQINAIKIWKIALFFVPLQPVYRSVDNKEEK